MKVECQCGTKFDDDITDNCPTCETPSGSIQCTDCGGWYDPQVYADCPFC